jgi:hypothetical protein
MSKYNYNNPIMQEVEKHCDAGHYPICLLESGEYAIFTPCRDGDGCIRRSYQEDTIEACQKSVGATYHSNSHYQPTEIVGFHHPPFKAYKKGDKVKVREDLEFVALKDYFLQRCFEILKNSEEARAVFNKISYVRSFIDHENDLVFWDGLLFQGLREDRQIYVVIKLLSRTPDGEAVIPFLDVRIENDIEITTVVYTDCELNEKDEKIEIALVSTLQEKMSMEFWKASSMQGKNIDQALEVINRTFINETLVQYV